MNITIKVDDRGMLYVVLDGDSDVTVTLVNHQLQTVRDAQPGEILALPYRIYEAELLSPKDWHLTPEAVADSDAFQRGVVS
jgi:hypothetical protein